MSQFNLGSFITKFIQTSLLGTGSTNSRANLTPEVKFKLTQDAVSKGAFQRNMPQMEVVKTFSPSVMADMRMNNLANLERSLYVKDLMNLPKDLQEALVMLQKTTAASKEAAKLLSSNIDLAMLAELIQKGGKDAVNKLVLAMSNASRQGITDLSQFKEAMKFINASVSVAGQDNLNQTLKTFMLLYLPWLPLQENVDFELEIETSENADGKSETSVTVMISTKNYGNVKVVLTQAKSNSISIFVTCVEEFPKEELLKRLNMEGKMHSLQSEIVFEEKKVSLEDNQTRQAKVSLSNMKEINPFLLLMVNATIRHTIEIDNQVV